MTKVRQRCRTNTLVFHFIPTDHISSHTLLRPTKSRLPLTQLVAHSHEYLSKPLPLPRWKHKNAGEVVVIPAHLLLAEEAHNLGVSRRATDRGGWVGIVRHKQVVEERSHVVKDGLRVEKELGEE